MSIGIADVYTSSVQDDAKAAELIRRALDLGVNFLDTANIYGDSEIKVGEALRGRLHGDRRAQAMRHRLDVLEATSGEHAYRVRTGRDPPILQRLAQHG